MREQTLPPFQMNSSVNFVAKLGGCALVSLGCCAGVSGASPHHYVFFNRDRERISEATFLGTKAFEGAQLKYTWRELEHEKDRYDFSAIQHDLAFLQAKGKQLFLQLQDASFDPKIIPVPAYLLNDAQYNGGADKQYGAEEDGKEQPRPSGWVARRWDPAVQERFHRLLIALGKAF